jgi:hypothetical protein
MNKIYNIKFMIVLLAGLVYLSSCEKKFDGTYTPYSPTRITNENVGLKYDPSVMDIYPVAKKIQSDTPTFHVEQAFVFGLDTVYHSSGESAFMKNKLSIDRETGVITYDNSQGKLLPGTLTFDVSVIGVLGGAFFKEAFVFNIKSVPGNITADPAEVEVPALFEGVISQLSYTGEGITSVSYKMTPYVQGFNVNDAGEVKKTVSATEGEHKLSFDVITNLGIAHFDDVITVTVLGMPSLKYVKQNGGDLTKVTLSPWTAYTTAPPVLEGMTGDAWEVILPDGAPQELANAVSIGADGAISVAGDMNIPEGSYPIGVKVSQGEVALPFDSLFVLNVVTQWDENPVAAETFDYATEASAPVQPPLYSYHVNGSEDKIFAAIYFNHPDDPQKPRDIHCARLKYDKNQPAIDVTLVMQLTNDGTWKNMKVKFGQFYGYNPAVLDMFERTLWYSYDDTELTNGTFTPENWIQVMASDDPDWLYDNLWNSPNLISDGDLPTSGYQEFSGLDPAQNDIYICWRYVTAGGDKGAQWIIDDIYVQVARAYDAIEE